MDHDKLQPGVRAPLMADAQRPLSFGASSIDHEHDEPEKETASVQQPEKGTPAAVGAREASGGTGSGGAGGSTSTQQTQDAPGTVKERLQPIVDDATAKRKTLQRTVTWVYSLLDILLACQLIIGGLITGFGAAAAPHTAKIGTTVLGGLSTLVAGGLTRLRGNGEPDRSMAKIRDLDRVLLDIKSLIVDSGNERPNLDDPKPSPRTVQLLKQIDDVRKAYDDMVERWNKKQLSGRRSMFQAATGATQPGATQA